MRMPESLPLTLRTRCLIRGSSRWGRPPFLHHRTLGVISLVGLSHLARQQLQEHALDVLKLARRGLLEADMGHPDEGSREPSRPGAPGLNTPLTPASQPPLPNLMLSEEPVYLYEGLQYRLGYEGNAQEAHYCVWSRETGSARAYPPTEDGWKAAWALFARLEAARETEARSASGRGERRRRDPRSTRWLLIAFVIAFYAVIALLLLAVVPNRFVASASFGGLMWVLLLGDTLNEVDRRRRGFEPTLLGMLVRLGVLIAIPAGFLAWRLLFYS